MKTNMADTSLKAYFGEVIQKANTKQAIVFNIIRSYSGLTNMEIANLLGWSINRVTPRVFELRKMGTVKALEKRKCSYTGRLAYSWVKDDNISAEAMQPFLDGGEYL